VVITELGEGHLYKMNRDMVIVVAQPGECCAQEIVDITHEVDFDVLY